MRCIRAVYSGMSNFRVTVFILFREKNAHENPNVITYGEDLDFGTNLDLSDEKIWKAELEELGKLPYWIQYKHEKNLLSYVGQPVLGVNTVQG